MSFPALQLRVCNPDGTYGSVLPGKVTCDLTLTDGTANAISFTYDAQDPTADLLVDLTTVACLIGGTEYQDMRFVLDDSGRDEVIEQDTTSWSALSVLGQLDYGIVLPEGLQYEVAGAVLGTATPGQGFRILLERCQARGALGWVTLGFTDGQDSAGQSWSLLDGELIEQGKTLLDVLENWHDRRIATARMDGTTLRLYRYGNQGVDRTADASGLLLRGRDLEDGPWNASSRDARSVMWARGDLPVTDAASGDGTTAADSIPIMVSEQNATALSRYGVREGWLSQQQVTSESQLRSIASGSLALTNRARDSYSYKLSMGGPLPVRDWTKGDVLQVRVAGRDRQMRVRAITINEAEDGEITGSVAFGDRMMDADEELSRTLERLTGQSMDGGLYGAPIVAPTSTLEGDDSAALVAVVHNVVEQAVWDQLVALGYAVISAGVVQTIYVPKGVVDKIRDGLQLTSTSTDGVRDAIPPGAVTNLAASSFPILLASGQLSGGTFLNTTTVRLTWSAPSDSDLAWYEVGYQDLEYLRDQDTGWWNSAATVGADIHGTSIQGLRPGVLYRFRVRAVDNWYNVSTWTLLQFRAGIDTTPPGGRPSVPTVTPILFSTLQVGWDGRNSDGDPFSNPTVTRVQVHLSTADNFTATGATNVGTIVSTDGDGGVLIVNDLDPGTTYYVRLLPITPWGIGGDANTASDIASGVPLDVFATGVADGSITPEKLLFDDNGNLLPDGSFERDGWRQAQLASPTAFRTAASGSSSPWVPGRLSGTGFTQLTASAAPAGTSFGGTVAGWTTLTGSGVTTSRDSVGGVPRKTGTGTGVWRSDPIVAFDPTVLYRCEIRIRCDVDSIYDTDQFCQLGILPWGNPSGTQVQAINYANTVNPSGWGGLPQPVAKAVTVAKGEVSFIVWVKGTAAAAPTDGTVGSAYDRPLPVPTSTTHLSLLSLLDTDQATLTNATMAVTFGEIRRVVTPAFDGQWVLDMAPSPNAYQRMDLTSVPSKGNDVFYVVGRVKLLGPLTNQPSAFIVAAWRDALGNVVMQSSASKSSGFVHDGWFYVEGRLTTGIENPYYRSGGVVSVDIYLAAYNVGTGQTLRWDAIEVRQAMTNVLIADLAVDNAKIKDLTVAKLTAGKMTATVVIGGSIETPTSGTSQGKVGLYSRSTSGRGYAAFAATDDAGLTTVLINAETGSAEFSGTVKAQEVTGYIRTRYGDNYLELTPGVSDFVTGIGPGLQNVYPTTAWIRSPAILKLTGPGIYLTPSRVHIAGTAQSSLTNSYFAHAVVAQRTNYTLAGDVDSVLGRTMFQHPYCAIILTDETFRGERGKFPGMWIAANDSTGGAAGISAAKVGTGAADYYVDAVRTVNLYGTQPLWCGMRANEFVTMSMAEVKDDFTEPDTSALAVIVENSSTWWRYRGEGYPEWHWGPMADGLPEWMHRPGGGLAESDKAGLMWRALEELVERDHDQRLQVAALGSRVAVLERSSSA